MALTGPAAPLTPASLSVGGLMAHRPALVEPSNAFLSPLISWFAVSHAADRGSGWQEGAAGLVQPRVWKRDLIATYLRPGANNFDFIGCEPGHSWPAPGNVRCWVRNRSTAATVWRPVPPPDVVRKSRLDVTVSNC